MSSSAAPPPGAADAPSTLRAYLARADHADVASMDEARFASWLAAEARARVLSDPGASLRAYARALRAHHAPTLDPLDASRATATDAYRAHPASARVERAERHLAHLRAAVVGIEAYLRTLDPAGPGGGENAEAKAARTRRKLDATRALVPEAEAEANAARDDAAPLLRDCRRTAEALASARDATGVALAERDAADAMRRAGARNVERGSGFEDVAAGVMRDAVEKAAGFGFGFGLAGAGVSAGGVSADESDADGGCSSSARLFLLRNVTLGSANFELDAVLVRATPEAGSREDGGASASGSVSDKASASSRNVFRRVVSDALAVFECKRGPDDIARGFEARQASLEWLAGGPGYDPDEWRNRRHPTGRFEGGAHFEKSRGETFAFAPGSFRRFKRDYACAETDRRFFVRGLWFVTRPVAMDGLDVKIRAPLLDAACDSLGASLFAEMCAEGGKDAAAPSSAAFLERALRVAASGAAVPASFLARASELRARLRGSLRAAGDRGPRTAREVMEMYLEHEGGRCAEQIVFVRGDETETSESAEGVE